MSKTILNVTLHMSELIYDVQNKTYLTGRSRKDGNNVEAVANMQADDDDENLNQVLRCIGDSYSDLKSRMSEYLTDSGTSVSNEQLSSSSDLTLSLLLPSNYNFAAKNAVSSSMHQYIVNNAVAKWFNITNKSDAAEYAAFAASNLSTLDAALNKRVRQVRSNPMPLTPELIEFLWDLYNNGVTADMIADLAVTSDKIDTLAIGTAKIAVKAVTTSRIDDNAVTNGKLADSSVTNAKIADGTIAEGKLNSAFTEKLYITESGEEGEEQTTGTTQLATTTIDGVTYSLSGGTTEVEITRGMSITVTRTGDNSNFSSFYQSSPAHPICLLERNPNDNTYTVAKEWDYMETKSFTNDVPASRFFSIAVKNDNTTSKFSSKDGFKYKVKQADVTQSLKTYIIALEARVKALEDAQGE